MAYSGGNAGTALLQKRQLSSGLEQREAAKKIRNARSPFSSPISGTNSVDASLLRKPKLESKEEQRNVARGMRTRRSDGSSLRSPYFRSGMQGRGAMRGGAMSGRSKTAQGDDREKSSKESQEMAIDNPSKQATAIALKEAWLSMTTLYAIPMAWLYINIHAFALMIPQFRDVFCQLGAEWLPRNVASSEFIASKLKKLSTLEKMLVFTVDFLVLIILGLVAVAFLILMRVMFGSFFDKLAFIFENWNFLKGLF